IPPERFGLDLVGERAAHQVGAAQRRRRRFEAPPPLRPKALDVEALQAVDLRREVVGAVRHQDAAPSAIRQTRTPSAFSLLMAKPKRFFSVPAIAPRTE